MLYNCRVPSDPWESSAESRCCIPGHRMGRKMQISPVASGDLCSAGEIPELSSPEKSCWLSQCVVLCDQGWQSNSCWPGGEGQAGTTWMLLALMDLTTPHLGIQQLNLLHPMLCHACDHPFSALCSLCCQKNSTMTAPDTGWKRWMFIVVKHLWINVWRVS